MYVDSQLALSQAQVVSASGASNNAVDLGPQNRNLADGEPVGVFFNLPVAPASGGTYQLSLQAADDSAFTVNLTTIATITLQASDLIAGKKGIIGVPSLTNVQRYVRAYYTLGGTSPSLTINAYIEPNHFVDRARTYLDNSRIQ